MNEKEFRRLRRQDLLQLLLVQGKEMAEVKGELAESNTRTATLEAQVERLKDKLNEKDETIERLKEKLNDKDAQMNEQLGRLKEKLNDKDAQMNDQQTRLKEKLDDKDAQIERLKRKLDDKDAQIETLVSNRRIAMEESGNLAEAALKINRIFEAAQEIADQYIFNLKQQAKERGITTEQLPEPSVKKVSHE